MTRSLVEVVFVAHFEAAPEITVLDLASWAASIESTYPIVQQQPAWPPVHWGDGPPVVMLSPVPVPRLMATDESQRITVHLQGDRVVFGWRRLEPTGDEAPYPGFDHMLPAALMFFEQFSRWFVDRFGQDPAYKLCELNYINALPLIKPSGEKVRLSEVFAFGATKAPRPIMNWNSSWLEPVPNAQARIHCNLSMQAGLDCPLIALFQFAGMGLLDRSGSLAELERLYKLLHDATAEAYAMTVHQDAAGSRT